MAAIGRYKQFVEDGGLELAEHWARQGLTDKQIAKEKIHISVSTLYQWKKDHPEFADALKGGKEYPDARVVNALYRMATGYWNEETVIDSKGTEHTINKWYPPNVTAAIYWTKNRMPKDWREKREDAQTEDKQKSFVALLPDRTEIDEGR